MRSAARSPWATRTSAAASWLRDASASIRSVAPGKRLYQITIGRRSKCAHNMAIRTQNVAYPGLNVIIARDRRTNVKLIGGLSGALVVADHADEGRFLFVAQGVIEFDQRRAKRHHREQHDVEAVAGGGDPARRTQQ